MTGEKSGILCPPSASRLGNPRSRRLISCQGSYHTSNTQDGFIIPRASPIVNWCQPMMVRAVRASRELGAPEFARLWEIEYTIEYGEKVGGTHGGKMVP